MWRIAAILAAIAAFVYVAVVGVQWLQPRVEDDILDRVNTTLAENGQLWADVQVNGREVILSGEAPDQDARGRALNLASRVFGVSSVSDSTVVTETVSATDVVPQEQPYQLTIDKSDDRITVRGQVASEQDAAVIRRLVNTHYQGMTIEDALEVVPNAPAGWRSAVGVLLMNMTNLEQAQVTISGSEVMLQGEVLDQRYSDDLQAAVRAALPKGYKVAFAVDVVTPTMPMPVSPTVVSGTDVVSEGEIIDTTQTSETVSETVAAKPVTATAQPSKTVAMPVSKTVAVVSKTEPVVSATAVKDVAPVRGQAARTAVAVPTAGELAAIPNSCAGLDQVEDMVVYFDFDRAALKAEYRPMMAKVAYVLKACENERLTVAGYTDTTGSSLYNQWLSEQRAESGVRALLRNGVNRTQVVGKGYGDAEPVGANTTRDGRALNRRVEFERGVAASDASAVNAGNGSENAADAVSPTTDSSASKPGWWSALFTSQASSSTTVSPVDAK